VIAELKRQAEQLALALGVVGLMNVQFAVKNGVVYLIEVNPRASRTVPFVAKTVGSPIAKIASRLMVGSKLSDFDLLDMPTDYIAVKEAVFPFARFPGTDPVLGPEMRSTGEVMGLDRSFDVAFAKSQLGAGTSLPLGGTVFVSVRDHDKPQVVTAVEGLLAMGFKVISTSGTADYLQELGLNVERVNKVAQGHPHIVDWIKDGKVQLLFNTTEGAQALKDSQSIRASAVAAKIPYYTTVAASGVAVQAIRALSQHALEVAPLQSYYQVNSL
jgi:carbamoyl-phosphate synthase large subunit